MIVQRVTRCHDGLVSQLKSDPILPPAFLGKFWTCREPERDKQSTEYQLMIELINIRKATTTNHAHQSSPYHLVCLCEFVLHY